MMILSETAHDHLRAMTAGAILERSCYAGSDEWVYSWLDPDMSPWQGPKGAYHPPLPEFEADSALVVQLIALGWVYPTMTYRDDVGRIPTGRFCITNMGRRALVIALEGEDAA